MWSAGPVRVYLGTPLMRVAGLYGCSVFLALFLACVCVIEQVGGVAGQSDFSSFPGFVLAGTVRLKWWGGAVFKFPLSSVCC